jgi:predicted enzyme related to lactoylglutathione lyase
MPNWVDIMVPDLQTGLSFYTSVLGWSYEDTGPDFNHFRLCQVDGKYAGGIGAVESPEQPVAWTVYLASDDLDATVKLINENGGSVIVGPMDIPETGRFAIAADNTGGVFGTFQITHGVGMQVHSEPGSLIWEDCRLTDVAAGRRFYRTVFGIECSELPGMPLEDYGTFSVPGAEDGRPVGGMGGLMGLPEGTPSHWLPYFSVADVDDAVAAAQAGGGSVFMPAEDTPFGRIGVVTDPFGAAFGLHSEVASD